MSVTKKAGGALQPAGGPHVGAEIDRAAPQRRRKRPWCRHMNDANRRTSPRSISHRRTLVNSPAVYERRRMSETRSVTGPVQLPPEAQLSVSAPHRVSMPLVGREHELEQLDAIFARAVEYQAPQLVTVVGHAGHRQDAPGGRVAGAPARAAGGGHRRAAARLSRARRRRRRQLRAHRAHPARSLRHPRERRRGAPPREGAHAARRRLRRPPHGRGRALPRPLPRSARSHAGDNAFIRAISLSEDPRQEDRIARTVLRRFLELDAERTPLVLAFDDLHLGDDDSLTLLAELAEGLGGSPVLLVAAARPELFVRRPGWGSGTRRPHAARSAAARRASSRRSCCAGCWPRPSRCRRELVEDACELTRGNPFFIEELVRVFHANGTVQPPTRAAATASGASTRSARAQATLPMSRRGGDPGAHRVAVAARARAPGEGGHARLGLLAGRAGGPAAARATSRRRARASPSRSGRASRPRSRSWSSATTSCKMPDSTVPGDAEYIFKHNLEHDLVLEAGAARARAPLLPRRRRVARDAAAAPTSASRPASSSSTRRRSTARAAIAARAAERYIAAADKARARYANDAAAELYARGLELLDARGHAGAHRSAARLRRRAAAHRQNQGGAGGVRRACSTPPGGSTTRPRPARRTAASRAPIARSATTTRAETHLERALGAVPPGGRHARRGRRRGRPRPRRVLARRLSARRSSGTAARSICGARSATSARLALSLHNLAMVHQASGAHAEAMMRFSEALAIRREIGDRPGVVQSLQAVASAWRDRGDIKRSFEVLGEALGLAQEIGDRLEQASILTRMGEALHAAGARSRGVRSPGAGERAGAVVRRSRCCSRRRRASLAEVYAQLGDLRGGAHRGAARARAGREGRLAAQRRHGPPRARHHPRRGGITDEDKAQADSHLQKSIEILGDVGHELELGRSYQSYADLLQRARRQRRRGHLHRARHRDHASASAPQRAAAAVRRRAADAYARRVAHARSTVPADVVELCRKLRGAGFEAWLVGGAVRDLLRGARGQGLRRGHLGAAGRRDARLRAQAHHPDRREARHRHRADRARRRASSTSRSPPIAAKAPTATGGARTRSPSCARSTRISKRRDFTMNAIAYDPLGDALADPYGGQDDLAARLHPRRRRSARALLARTACAPCARCASPRSSSSRIDPPTEAAIPDALDVFRKVSAERVRDELVKILSSRACRRWASS